VLPKVQTQAVHSQVEIVPERLTTLTVTRQSVIGPRARFWLSDGSVIDHTWVKAYDGDMIILKDGRRVVVDLPRRPNETFSLPPLTQGSPLTTEGTK